MGRKKDEKKKDARIKPPVEAVMAEIPQAVTQAARSMRTVLSRSLLDAGLYAGQDGVMRALAMEEGLTPGTLAQRLGVKAPTMTRTIGRMEAQGFITRRGDGSDQRLTKVHLTEAGKASIERIARAVDACTAQALAGFSAKQMRQLLKLLKAIDGNLNGKGDDPDFEEARDEE